MKKVLVKLLIVALSFCFMMCVVSACRDAHTHVYDKQLAISPYFHSRATCTEKAKYYFSCECGEKSTETFEYGQALGHQFDKKVPTSEYLVTSATCTEKAKYYFSCECGEKDIRTFAYGQVLGHEFTDYISDNNATYEKDGTKTSVCNRDGCVQTDTITDVGTKLQKDCIAFKTLDLEEKTVFANSVEEFSFVDEVQSFGKSSFVVSKDKYGENIYLEKIVPLFEGDNVFYVFEMIDGDVVNTYTVNIRRRPMYTVSFNTGIDTEEQSQEIEEGFTAIEPETQFVRGGYDFGGWDFDFNTKIVQDVQISAKWNALFTLSASTITGLTDYGKTCQTITIPSKIDEKNITAIGTSAFDYCYSLESVTIGNSVTSIGSSAFSWCSSLQSITVAEDNTAYKSIDGNLYSKDGKTLIQYAKGKTATEFTIPSGVTNIGSYAFYGCDLQSVTIGNSVTSIGNSAFKECDSLESVTIGNSVTSIGNSAFSNCYSLESVTIGDSVTSIGEGIFFACRSLESIEIPNSIKSISNNAFRECSKLANITMGNGVTSIGFLAFCNCSSLQSITIPNSVTSIDYEAFDGCELLQSIIIPNSVTSIGYSVFYDCNSLETIYCEAESQPSGWSSYWKNNCNAEVVWGHTGE